ncbi:MAG: MFS transporter [Nitrososphaerales archaeon]|nr:MFS transporter [Nitrososphaerales archaeon]
MDTRSRAAALFLYNSCLAVFLSYGVFFSRISTEFNLPASSTSLVFGVFAALYSASSLLLGLFMNRRGPATTMLVGGALMGGGLFLSSLANSFPLLLLTYGVIGGSGSGSMWLPTSYVVFDSFGSDRIRQVTGLVSAGTAAGLLFFPPLEAYLIAAFGLRAAFAAVGGVVLLFTLLAYQSSRGTGVAPRFDFGASVRNLRTRRFGYLYTYYAAGNAFARILVTIFVVPLFESRGLGPGIGTLALSMVGVGSMMGRLSAGARGVSEETMAALGFFLQGVSALGLYFSTSAPLVILFAVLFGAGYGTYIPEFALLVRKYYGVENYGTIFGTLLTSFGIGAFIGPVFEGSEISSRGDYLIGFILAAAASIAVGAHLILVARNQNREQRNT